jgi:hypothetical protein
MSLKVSSTGWPGGYSASFCDISTPMRRVSDVSMKAITGELATRTPLRSATLVA